MNQWLRVQAELEGQLRERDQNNSGTPTTETFASSSAIGGAAASFSTDLGNRQASKHYLIQQETFPWHSTEEIKVDLFAPSSAPIDSRFVSAAMDQPMIFRSSSDQISSELTAMINPLWPKNVPHMELLIHLIDIFFSCAPYAHRVLHRPTFMASLLNHPSSAEFP